MLPLLPFIAGLVTGAVTAKLWRNGKTSQTLANAKAKTSETLESARTSIREATVSGLSRLEASSAAMREKLTAVEAAPDAATPEEAPAPAPVTKKATRPRKADATPGAGEAPAEPVAGETE